MTNISPYNGKPMQLRLTKTNMNFRKEPFEIIYHSYICANTGEEFEDDNLSAVNYNQVIDRYREKHNIPFPEQIKKIRENYGLSARRMSDILGLGTNTWRLYENGDVPTIANARLIKLISDPENFLKQITEFGDCKPHEIEQIKTNIKVILKEKDELHVLEKLFQVSAPDRKTGYSMFNKQKLKEAVCYFAEKMQPYKTALNKLLFYTDFLHFKKTGRSLTGLRYVAIDFGPVPNHYSSLYEMMLDEGIIKLSGNLTDFGYTERFYLPEEKQYDISVFSDAEIETLLKVFTKFNNISTSDIVAMSHKEEAWVQFSENKSLIPYTMAYFLKAIPD